MCRQKGRPSTNADVLEEMVDQHPIIGIILEHRKLGKLQGYFDGLYKMAYKGRMHAHIMQCNTATGRLAMEEPSLQTMPKPVMFEVQVSAGAPGKEPEVTIEECHMRRAFVPRPGSK